jgi:hypothetical protein
MDILLIAAGVIGVALAGLAIEALYTGLTRPQVMEKRFPEPPLVPSAFQRIYPYLLVAGAFNISVAALYGLLFWLEPLGRSIDSDAFNASQLRAGLSFVGAFGLTMLSTSLLDAVDQLNRLRRALATLGAAKALTEQLSRGSTLDESWSSFDSSEDPNASDRVWLRGRLEDLRRFAAHQAPKPSAEPRQAPSSTSTSDPQIQRRFEAVSALTDSLLPITRDRSNEVSSDSEASADGLYVVNQGAMINAFAPFKSVASLADLTDNERESGHCQTDMTSAFLDLPGLTASSAHRLLAIYEGNAKGGYTRFVARAVDGTEIPLVDALTFDQSLSGALGAFFIAHVLPTYGRFWHGRYDFDYMLFPHQVPLVGWLARSGFSGSDASELSVIDRPAALTVLRRDGILEVAAYGAGETTPLTLFGAEIASGRLSKVTRRVVLSSRVRTLY